MLTILLNNDCQDVNYGRTQGISSGGKHFYLCILSERLDKLIEFRNIE